MEAGSTSETSVNFYHTTQRNNPEDSHLQGDKTLQKCKQAAQSISVGHWLRTLH
jgi:hypothetical protein